MEISTIIGKVPVCSYLKPVTDLLHNPDTAPSDQFLILHLARLHKTFLYPILFPRVCFYFAKLTIIRFAKYRMMRVIKTLIPIRFNNH